MLEEASVVAVTSKIVSLCENRFVPFDKANREDLIINESERYLPKEYSKYGHHFTIARNTLIASAGIDESNGGGFVLWPEDAQKSANSIRKHLAEKSGLTKIGVIITDSTCQPLRRGTSGIMLAWSGFKALNNYIGEPDLFGRPLAVTQAAVGSGLAAAAVLAMGEGSEQTPLALLSDLPFVEFQNRSPDQQELAKVIIDPADDLFEPILKSAPWQPGHKN